MNFERLYRMHKLIEMETTGTPDQFAKQLSIKRRQLYNMLDKLKHHKANIAYSRVRSTFYYKNKFDMKWEIGVIC